MQESIIISCIRGGFGNQLLQFATGYALSQRVKYLFKLDLEFFDIPKFKSAWRLDKLNVAINEASYEEISELRNLACSNTLFCRISRKLHIPSKYNKYTHYNDSEGFEYQKSFFRINSSKYLYGWFTKPDYFNEFRSDLIKMYTPKFELSEEYFKILNSILHRNSVSIHVRRGDYVDNKIFLTKGMDYYISAIKLIVQQLKNSKFYIFSDDIIWCRENFADKYDFNFVSLKNNNADLEEFFLMKNCKHNIIANSSFSWWAAYLNENPSKIVIAPKVWYKDAFYQTSLDNNPSFLINWITI